MLKLNIACGPHMFPGFINLDLFDMSGYLETLRTTGDISTWPEHQQKIAAHARDGNVTCGVWDLRDGFPQYADNTVDAIYFGQALEHLQPVLEAPAFLCECWRMLKPGGKLRITTPDLDLMIQAYLAGEMDKFEKEQPDFYMKVTPDAQLSFLMFGACGPQCKRESYEGHFFIHGKRSMRSLLETIGFIEVDFETKSDVFSDAVDVGRSHSLFVEAKKP